MRAGAADAAGLGAAAAGALRGRDCTGVTGADGLMLDVGDGSVCAAWNGLLKGSAIRSDPAQPASKPAEAPIRVSRNATREQKIGTM